MIRDDLSDKLIHLTKGETKDAASDLLKILTEGRLRGWPKSNTAKVPCICFCEAPISKLAHILATDGMRYRPFGVMVEKRWLFERGGRPVIYQPDTEYNLLHDELKYRHVPYNPTAEKPIDTTWEREWRIQTDELRLDPDRTTVVVPNRDWEDYILTNYSKVSVNFDTWITNRIDLNTVVQSPKWHLIVLEDLGVPFPSVDPPI